jgi:hypothetical protein
MSKGKEKDGIKSAYELAMERLGKGEGPVPALTDDQKAALAEVDRDVQARIAETEIMLKQKIEAARASADPEKVEELERERIETVNKIRADGETQKEKIRAGT